nr:phage portal protein [Paracoccus aminovorans]
MHLPPEQLADLTTDSIAAGVELDDAGRATASHVHPIRPDALQATYAPPVHVPAADVLHVFDPKGPGQVRGVSALAPILLALPNWTRWKTACSRKPKSRRCFPSF